MLFPIRQLIGNPDYLLSIPQTTKVRDALAIMLEHDYSQLPIVDHQGRLSGIITEQSIVNTYFVVGGSVSLLDMSVDHCQSTPVTISPDSNIFDALDKLKTVYAVIVVENQKPVGILTDFDTTHFFRNYSEGLIQVQDIETRLRQYIEAIWDTEEKLKAALVRAFGMDRKDPSKIAKEYDELSFWDTILLMTTDKNWEKCAHIFQSKELLISLMEQVRDVRNQLSHFRGELNAVQRKILVTASDWMDARPKFYTTQPVRDYVDRREHPAIPEVVKQSQGKYDSLQFELSQQLSGKERIRMSFPEIENIIIDELPPSARKHRAWWANDPTHVHALAWLRAGWLVDDVDLAKSEVTFLPSDQAKYVVFFKDLLDEFKRTRPGVTQAEKSSVRNWLSFRGGVPGFSFAWVLPKDAVLRVEIYIDTGDKDKNKAAFDILKLQQDQIEQEIGGSLSWDRLDSARACRIYITIPFRINEPPEKHRLARQWGVDMMTKFVDAFQPRIRNL